MYENEGIRVLLFEEHGSWIAQCVEYDIGTQGVTMDEASRRMEAVLKLEGQESLFRTGQLFGGIPPAPNEFSELWDSRPAPNSRHGAVKTDSTSIHVHFAVAA